MPMKRGMFKKWNHLDSGVNKDSANIDSMTHLYITCRLGSFAMPYAYLPADFEYIDNYGYTSLFLM